MKNEPASFPLFTRPFRSARECLISLLPTAPLLTLVEQFTYSDFRKLEHTLFGLLSCHVVNTFAFDESTTLMTKQRLRSAFRAAYFFDVRFRYHLFSSRALVALRRLEPLFTRLPFSAQGYACEREAGS